MRTWWLAGALAWTLGTTALIAVAACWSSDTMPPAPRTAAVLPAVYFSADAVSAARLTDGLREEMSSRGWKVVPAAASAAAASAVGFAPRTQQPDAKALEFGRRLKADVVVYPRLLALGVGFGGPDA